MTEQTVIKPTPGRVVWYHYRRATGAPVRCLDPMQPMAAIVAYVHDDRRVNLLVIDHGGKTFEADYCLLVQPEDERPNEDVSHCTWMPYQIGQAKTEVVITPTKKPAAAKP